MTQLHYANRVCNDIRNALLEHVVHFTLAPRAIIKTNLKKKILYSLVFLSCFSRPRKILKPQFTFRAVGFHLVWFLNAYPVNFLICHIIPIHSEGTSRLSGSGNHVQTFLYVGVWSFVLDIIHFCRRFCSSGGKLCNFGYHKDNTFNTDVLDWCPKMMS